ncbi:MAG: amidohydrolase family protein, partial [Pirellulaceae bacterium]|nr:amidohydrolase family protein [Pirellulaceae bacterium]
QDEILALIRVCDDYNVTIGSLQHILEGYKVADVMAKHGATGSSFSDWWAYKYEVIDAIPFNGALMHRQGVVVSFNSDDAELARHLNHEAAKAVKYGGVPAEEALKFVTLNPARQLRIDTWVGSLEAGKQADFVVWNAEPLAVTSRCLETWVDGRKYFDRNEDRSLRAEQQAARAKLIRRVLESGETPRRGEASPDDDSELWPRTDEFCAHNQAR